MENEPITETDLRLAVGELALMKYFPAGPEPRAAVMDMLSRMCRSAHELEWLTRRMNELYSEWPGARELRACYCSKFRPVDNKEVFSETYPEGIPSERATLPALPAPSTKALPPGRTVSAALSVDLAVCDLARAKDMNRLGPALRVRDIPSLPPGVRPITKADCDEAARKRRDEIARAELGGEL